MAFGGLGRDKRKPATQLNTKTCVANTQLGAWQIAEIPTTQPIDKTLMNFARDEMARCACQSVISGPKTLWVISQLCSLGEERANAKAATNMKEVVGSRGRKTPIVPKPTHKHPKMSQKIRFGKKIFMTNTPFCYPMST